VSTSSFGSLVFSRSHRAFLGPRTSRSIRGQTQMLDGLPSQKTILLVEDDADLREAIGDVLRDAGRAVVEAGDGQEALAKLEMVERPCLVLLDLLMPRMDGFEFLRRLNALHDAADFPVLVISAHGNVGAAEHFPGVLGTLRKPFDASRLLELVNEHC